MDLNLKNENIRKILIIRIGSLGDAIMSTPAFTALHEAYPKAWISLLTTPGTASLFEGDPRLNEVLTFNNRDMRTARKVFKTELIPLERELKEREFDLVVDLRGNGLTARLTYKSKARWRAGYHSLQRGLFFGFKYNIKAKPPASSAHRVELARAIIAPLGIRNDYTPEIHVPQADKEWASRFLAENHLNGAPLLAVQPGASSSDKCWSVDQFYEVAEMAVKNGAGVVILGTSDQKEAVKLQEIGHNKFTSAVGKTTPRQLAALIQASDVLLGNDSGPTHLASALGTPAVAIFLVTDPQRYGPYGTGHKVFTSPSSSDDVWKEVRIRLYPEQENIP